MKKIIIIILAIFAISQIPVVTVYEDGSTYRESLGNHLVYKYIKVPLAHVEYNLNK